MGTYFYVWSVFDLFLINSLTLILILIGFLAESISFLIFYTINKNNKEKKKYLTRSLISLPITLMLSLIALLYVPKSLVDYYFLPPNIWTLFVNAIDLLMDSLLTYGIFTLLYAIYLKVKKQPGAIWHIKKFTILYSIALIYILIMNISEFLTPSIMYIFLVSIPFLFFHLFYYIFRKYKKEIKRIIKRIKTKKNLIDVKIENTENEKFIFLLTIYLVISILLGGITVISSVNNKSLEVKEVPKEQPIKEVEEETKEVEYKFKVIDNQSNGIIYFPSYSENGDYRFLFKNSNTGETYSLTENLYEEVESFSCENDWGCSTYASELFIMDDEIYFLHGEPYNPLVKKFDIFTGETTTLDLEYLLDKPVQAFFIFDNILYYLNGEICNYYLATCDLQLNSYNLETRETRLLASNLSSRRIEGFDTTGERLIMFYGEGDAGCIWGSFEEYNINTGNLLELGSFSYCYDFETDEIYPQDQPEVEKYEAWKGIVKDVTSISYIKIVDGEIEFPLELEEEQEVSQELIRTVIPN